MKVSRLLRTRRSAAAGALLLTTLWTAPFTSVSSACQQPKRWSLASAFDLAANGLLPASYPQLPAETGVRAIPPSVLKAIGWVESRWRQFTPQGRPLVSFDFGYGVMQVTSGMAGAFGSVDGTLDPEMQSQIASDYVYNIAYGAQMLARKWTAAPRVGNGDPAVVENWYYALWAYNGWGWVNNPNNPRFTRQGTPASNPSNFPYQERVLYLVAHPPRDRDGNPLWQPVPVTLPDRRLIGTQPAPLSLARTHRQEAPQLSAVYAASSLSPLQPLATRHMQVRIVDSGTEPWAATGSSAVSLAYHLFTSHGNPWKPFSPFTNGVVAFGQGVAPLPRSLLPGQSATIDATIQAPGNPGTYRVAWDLQQGASTWFSQEGVLPRAETLQVLAPGQALNSAPMATPTPTPEAQDDLRYLADTSVPDGSELPPRHWFLKGWLVFNNGRRSWGQGWALHLISGRPFAARTIAVPLTPPCHSATIVAALRSPSRPGSYTSVWRMEDAHGHAFGDRLTVVVGVRAAGVPPTPGAPASPTPRPGPTPAGPTATATPVG